MEAETFSEWAILELFGHQRLAGMVTAVNLGGASFVRVDVPDIEKEIGSPAKLSKFLNPSAIYSITPVTEETARAAAKSCSAAPITRWDVQELVDRATRPGLPRPVIEEDDYDQELRL